ncbi:MAG: FliH/SctL family protein [Alphaproteobacteria bacterium]|nr:FliH/SctL family protein [Alphaproteobacteria bacterium]
MGEAEKFLFDASFDAKNGSSVDDRARLEEERRREEQEQALTELRAAAFEEGRQAGFAEANQSIAQATAQTLANIRTAMDALHGEREAIKAQMQTGAAEVALALMRKFLPEFVRRNSLEEFEGLIQSALAELLGEPRVVVRVHDGMLDPIRERIDGIAGRCGYDGDVVLLADPELQPSDCMIEWADGGAERSTERLWQEIEAAASRMIPAMSLPGNSTPKGNETGAEVGRPTEPLPAASDA